MKAISAEIYEGKRIGNCSNNGISSRFSTVLIPDDEGWIDVDENDPPENLCKVVTRTIFGKEYKHIEPYKKAQHIGWMAGGAIVYTSDSRFDKISEYPLCLHDRQETYEQYNELSD